ncbi:ABC transporter ATP-binding protein [Tepidanaerobacter syntrophicus]|uniref:ABC transporter ATP-binding protein n=1 Tax=Tepidanaerobacter syntrophicus TaxID=224999 RepID=UPI001BD26B37|nr:ABC transporter ATP-binding protein [Tepidanaerobacter syntrophicus]
MLLRMENITKLYGSLLANDNVSLTLDKGEILAIVGENGAGKSTLMKILYGLEMPTSGEIYINDKLCNFKSPMDAIRQGIGMVQQNFMLFNPFTVAENIVYGKEPRSRRIFFNRRKAAEIVRELCRKYGLEIDPELKVEDCPVGLQQRVEILKVLYKDAEIIILDEPSAVLTPQEVDELLKTIKGLAALGKSIILITHKLQEVMDVADRIMVMREGKRIAEVKKTETSIEELSYLMVGRRLAARKVEKQKPGKNVLKIENLTYVTPEKKNVLKGVNIHVDEGEIVGIAGVSGNGQSELIQCITGMIAPTGGKILLDGKDITGRPVWEVRYSGLSHIPEDRYYMGCAKDANLVEVAIMGHHIKPAYSQKGILKTAEIRKFTRNLLTKYDVRHSSLTQKAKELSGGNIQKLIVAREIEHGNKFLVAAEPTRGVDIGAMEFIHDKILEVRSKGGAVLLISSELTEILSLSDRIYVMYGGNTNGEFTREEATSEKLGLLMMGGKLNE